MHVLEKLAPADRRASRRYSSGMESCCLPATASITDTMWTATIRDISTGGIALMLGHKLEPGAVMHLVLPGKVQSALPRTLQAQVVRVLRLPHNAGWLLG